MLSALNHFRVGGVLFLALAFVGHSPAPAQGFTSARVASAVPYVSLDRVAPGATFRMAVALKISEGWHVNAHQPTFDYLIPTKLELAASTSPAGITMGAPIYPEPVEKPFSFTGGKKLRVYEGTTLIGLEAAASAGAPPGPRTVSATLTTQACDDNSCLAPARIPVEFTVVIAAAGEPSNPAHPEIFGAIRFGADGPAGGAPAGGEDTVGRWIEERGWGVALVLIFLGGLALNLTPCVYPVIPITLAYFGGQAPGRPARTFGLASLYVLGMCLTYSTLGVVAAMTGSILGSALQSPLALIFVAAVMVALALSMFGLYDIQVPSAVRQRITSRPGMGGALFMGLTVGLVAAPCVGPFVVSLLAYVGQAGSPVLGFWLFFVLALGLGLPYLVLGGLSGAATGLPRAGAWMDWVKKVFGCILLAMALYFVGPLLPAPAARLGIPVILGLSGLYLGFMEGSPIRSAGFRLARYATAAACLAAAAFLLVPSDASAGVQWEPYTDEALAAAAAAGRPAIIDFTADWCLPCRELEHWTFSNPEVVAAAERFVRLKADITRTGSTEVQALQKQHEILGAPTIVFIDSTGREQRGLRLTGFEDAPAFLERMQQVH